MTMQMTFNPTDATEAKAVVALLVAMHPATFKVSAVPASPQPQTEAPAGEPAPAPSSGTSPGTLQPKAMNKAKKLAEDNGIDWRTLFPGSGKDGMVRQDDVLRAIKARKEGNGKDAAPAAKSEPEPEPTSGTSGPPTFAETRAKLGELVQANGKEAASALLVEHFPESVGKDGIARISAVPERHWLQLMKLVDQALA